jgi:lantibiotic biosynthesis protein
MTVRDGLTAPASWPSPRSPWRPGRDLTTAVEHVLASWTAAAASGTAGPDLGPAVLVALVHDPATTARIVPAWLRAGARCRSVGLHGGMSGFLAGLRLIARVSPGVATAAERTAASLAAVAARGRWRTTEVGFEDYDLVSGPAGMLLAQTVGDLPARPEHLATLTAHLATLGADADLSGLCIGAHRDHPLVGWAQGGVVTGLAHGVAGVVVALCAAYARTTPAEPPTPAAPPMPSPNHSPMHSPVPPPTSMPMPMQSPMQSPRPMQSRMPSSVTDDAIRAVSHLSAWLSAERTVDGLGIATWPRRGPMPSSRSIGAVRRQAWCYGCPGVSWALWTAGDALSRAGRPDGEPLREAATAAMRSLCEGYDPAVHLGDDPLGICHGAAGMMLAADAFARHAGLAPAAVLRDRLADFLFDRLDDVVVLGESDLSLLSGASGVLAALLTVTGADRAWLHCLGLS